MIIVSPTILLFLALLAFSFTHTVTRVESRSVSSEPSHRQRYHIYSGEGDQGSSETPEADSRPRILFIGNELLNTSLVANLTDNLLRSTKWMNAGEVDGDSESQPPHKSLVYTHYHVGYTLGPNPFAEDFEVENYEQFDGYVPFRSLDSMSGTPLSDPSPISITTSKPRSGVSPYNLVANTRQSTRKNTEALLAKEDTRPSDPTVEYPIASELYQEARYRLDFPSNSSTGNYAHWLAYDTEEFDLEFKGFHGEASQGRGIAVFKDELQHYFNFADVQEEKAATGDTWPEYLPPNLTLSVWIKIDKFENGDAIFDCRSSELAKESDAVENYIQFLPKRSEMGLEYMWFEYNDNSQVDPDHGTIANYVTSLDTASTGPAGTTPDEVLQNLHYNSLHLGVWKLWTITISESGTMFLYEDSVQVDSKEKRQPSQQPGEQQQDFMPNYTDPNTGIYFPPYKSFPLPQVKRSQCVLGMNQDLEDREKQQERFFSGKIADFTLWKKVLSHDEVISLYLDRPKPIHFIFPPETVNFLQAKPTKLSHASCPGTLKLFDKTHTPKPWKHIILQDHLLAPYIPWMQRHSTIPGILSLLKAIWEHSPEAEVKILQTWPQDPRATDIAIYGLKARDDAWIAGRNISTSSPTHQPFVDALWIPGGSGTFYAGSDEWNGGELVDKSVDFWERILKFLSAESENLSDLPAAEDKIPVLSTAVAEGKLSILPVAQIWQQVERHVVNPKAREQAAADKAEKGKQDGQSTDSGSTSTTPPTPPTPTINSLYNISFDPDAASIDRTTLQEFRDASIAQLSGIPSAIGAFATALSVYVSLAEERVRCVDEGNFPTCTGYCPCNLADASFLAVARDGSVDESEEEKQARLVSKRTMCAAVRLGVEEWFQDHIYTGGDRGTLQSASPSVATIVDGHSICGFSCGNETDDGCSHMNDLTDADTGTDPAHHDKQPGDEQSTTAGGDGIDTQHIPGENDGDANLGTKSATDDTVEAPSLTPLIVVMCLLVISVVTAGVCYWYRSKRDQWELVDSRGYDERDKEAYDLERMGDDL